VIAQLGAEIDRSPARERLRGLLMLALYRAGRQADALQAYQEARRYLVSELGLEPGAELRELQDRILRQDPSLDDRPQDRQAHAGSGVSADRGVQAGPRRRPSWRWVVIAALSTLVLIGVVEVTASTGGSESAALATTLRAPAIGLLDAQTGLPRAAGSLGGLATRMVEGGGAIWATSYDSGDLLRIDPHSLSVTQTIGVGHGATGIAVAGGDVWVASSLDGTVTRVDIATNTIVQQISVGTDPTDMAAGDGTVWVSNTADGTVSRVDDHTGQVIATIPVGGAPSGIAVGAGGVWIADAAANEIVRLEPGTGRVIDRIQTGEGPTQIAVGRDGVWVANDLDSTVSLIDPSSDTVTLTRAVAGIPGALAPAGDGVWVAARDRSALTLVQAAGGTHEAALPSPATALATTLRGLLVSVRGVGADHGGGTLVVRLQGTLPSADPGSCCDLPPDVRDLAYDGLLSISKQPGSAGTLVPDLALAIPHPQAGGLLYTFRLRSGLRYSNGSPVRASDFVRGLELAAQSSDIWAGYVGSLRGALSCPRRATCDLSRSVIANDRASTLTLQLSHPDPELLPALGLSAFAPAPPTTAKIRPGTGPYRITSFRPNDQIIFERNRYFREWAPVAQPAGYPDRIDVDYGTSNTADINAVLTGHADFTSASPTPAQLAQIELHQPGQLHIAPLPELDFLFLNTHAPPFNDVRVRQALNYAINRAAIVKLLGGPAAATPACQTIPVTIPGRSPYCPYTRTPTRNGRWTGPDLTKARALIAASGTRGDTVAVLTQPSGAVSDVPTARLVVAVLRELGLNAHLRLLPPDQWAAAMHDYHHSAQIGTESWGADFISATQFLTDQLSCAAWNPPIRLNNHAQFCDHQVDALTQRAAQLEPTDPVAANVLWARADRLATDLAPWLPTVSENETDLVSRRVGDYHYVACGSCSPLDQLWVR
jgi:peptide/nickel transport system substrate-binding protein